MTSKTVTAMRKIFSFLMSVAVAATTFVGCTNTEINIDSTPTPTPTGTYRQLTFSTEQDASRTHHNGETIIWSKGDKIRIGYTKDGVWQGAKGDSSAAKLYVSNELGSDCEYSKFTLTTLFKDTDATGPIIFYGLYPSNITKRNEPDFADSAEGTINVVLPQIQSPAATSFDSNADLMVSQSVKTYEALPTYEEHISMRWTRLVTHGMITLKNLTAAGITADEKVQYVTIEADAEGDALTGEFTLDIDGQTLTPIDGKSKNKVRLSYADTDYNTLTDADEDGAADDFVVWFATAPFEATSLTITVGTDKATYTREITSANKTLTFVVNKRNKLGINMASATPVEIETEDNWMMVQDKTKFVDGITVIIAKMFSSGSGPALNTDGDGTSGSITVSKDDNDNTYTATSVGDDIQQFKLGVNPDPEVSEQYSFQALNGDNAGKYLSAFAPYGDGSIRYVQEETFWYINTGEFKTGQSTQLGDGDVKLANGSSILTYYSNPASTTFNQKFCTRESFVEKYCAAITLYYNATALPSLSAPVINSAKQAAEGNAVQVVWGEVENALSYTITATCEGKEDIVVKNITDTTYTVDGFVEGTWTITVTAEADYYKSATSAGVQVEVIDQTPRITVTPTELAFTSAGGTKSITVETAYFGANVEISAESDNNAFSVLVDGTTVSVTAEANVTDAAIVGTITVTATDGATTLTADVTVQQAAKSNATAEWQLLTDLRSLQTNEELEVIIAAADYDKAMASQNSNNRKSDAITKSDDKSTLSEVGADVRIFQLKQGATSDTWAFFDELQTVGENMGGYLYAASSSNNYLRTQAGLDANASWTISLNEDVLSIVATGENTHNVMQYNAAKDDELFSCYDSASQKSVALYFRKASTEPRILSLTVDNNEISYEAGSQITVTVTTKYAEGQTLDITLTDSNGTIVGSGTATINDNVASATITAQQANDTQEPRVLTLTASLKNGASKSITISQGIKPTEGVNATDYIDREFTGVATGTSYSAWSDKTGASGAVYAGNSAGSNNAVQLRSNNSNSGIVTTKSVGKVTRIVIRWNSNTTSGRTLNIYGKNSAYSAATDLYDNSTSGELLGTIDYGDYGTTEFIIEGDYAFVGLRSSSGAMYLDYVQIVWGDGGDDAPVVPTTPELSVNPTTLLFEAEGGDKDITCTIENEVSGVNVTASESADWLSTSVNSKTVTVTATANTSTSERTATVTVSYDGATSQTVTVTQAGATQSGGGEGGSDHVYTKVTSAPADWSGQYLIVYEGGNAAFNGSLATLDDENNYTTVTISNNQISLSAAEDTFYFTIAKTSNGYSIKSASGTYIGRTANSNGMNTGTTVYNNTISLNGGDANIIGSGSTATYLRFNKAADQMRFRYYKSGQQPIQLYKLEGDGGNAGGGDTPATPTQLTMSTVTCTAQTESSLTFSWSAVTGATGYQVSTDNSTWSSPNGNLSHTLSGLTADTQYTLYVKAIGDGTNYTDSTAVSAQGTTSAASGGGEVSETIEMTTFSAPSASMDSYISYTTARGGGTANPAINGGEIRLYQNSAGTGGGTITITAANGATLSSVSIGSSMNTSVAYTIESSTTKSTTASLAANGKYTVNDINATSITFYCMGTSSSSRLYVNYLSVTYTK